MGNRNFKIALVFLTLFWSTQYAYSSDDNSKLTKSDSTCSSNPISEKIFSDLNIDLEGFGNQTDCQPESELNKLVSDVQLLQQGVFQDANTQPLIGGFIPSDQYYPWLRSQTKGIRRMRSDETIVAHNVDGQFILHDGWPKQPTIDRIGTLLHEARHTEGHFHVRCQHGPYFETPFFVCDESFSGGGAHAVEIEYFARVTLKGKNFHPMYKSMARLLAMARANSETPPTQLDFFSYFKFLADSARDILDFEEFDLNNKRHVLSVTTDNHFSIFNFTTGEWRRSQPLGFKFVSSSSLSPSDENGFYVVDDDSNVHSFDPQSYQFINQGIKWPKNIQSLTRVSDEVFALDKNGKLFKKRIKHGFRLPPFRSQPFYKSQQFLYTKKWI